MDNEEIKSFLETPLQRHSTIAPSNTYQPPIFEVSSILGRYFVKYNKLMELIRHGFSYVNSNTLNVYIDLYGAIKPLFSTSGIVRMSNDNIISNTIINACSHYIKFFKGIGVDAKIFLVFGYNTKSFAIKEGYNKEFADKVELCAKTREIIDANMDILELLCPYLRNVYFIRTMYETSITMDKLITDGDGSPNLIISTDSYPIQLTYLHPATALIKPRKRRTGDESIIITTKENPDYVGSFWTLVKTTGRKVGKTVVYPANFPFLVALSGYIERSCTTLKLHVDERAALAYIYETMGEGGIIKYVNDYQFELFINWVSSPRIEKAILRFGYNSVSVYDIPRILEIYNAVDILSQRSLYSIESKGTIKLLDLYDPTAVNQICSRYFANPIDIFNL